jgi:hypothetical protein
VAVATSTLPSSYAWIVQVRDGVNTPDPPAWLSAFPFTRLTRIRGGRAYAVVRGMPFWPAQFTDGPCEMSLKIPLVGSDGNTCGTLELPIEFDPTLTCTTTANSATLARDGSVLVQTRASATDASGATHQLLYGTLWPKLLQ